MSLLAEARTAINYMINDVIDETMTSTSRDESIVATITPFDEGLESDRWGWTMPKVAILEWGVDAIPRGGTDDVSNRRI